MGFNYPIHPISFQQNIGIIDRIGEFLRESIEIYVGSHSFNGTDLLEVVFLFFALIGCKSWKELGRYQVQNLDVYNNTRSHAT